MIVVAIVFMVQTDSWYLAFKGLHVVAAVLWIGGGTMLTFLALVAERSQDPERMLALVRQAEWAGTRVFAPASVLVLAFGIAMVVNASFDWGTFWISFGLAAWALSAVTGNFYLTPQIKKLNGLLSERGPADADVQALIRRILLAARLDVAVLLLIVVDMTVKPFS